MRYETEAVEALAAEGFQVKEKSGVSDCQGWGALLGYNPETGGWATLAWTYGSCSFCDAYEDLTTEQRERAFKELVEKHVNEEKARRVYEDRKGW